MSLLNFVLVALLASSTARAGIPQYIQGKWVIKEETPLYDDGDGQFLSIQERLWPDSTPEVVEVVTAEYQDWPTTPEPYSMMEQADAAGEESGVWKVILVVAILLVSVVGSLSVAYYMCVWRGGRIHYQPQKVDYA